MGQLLRPVSRISRLLLTVGLPVVLLLPACQGGSVFREGGGSTGAGGFRQGASRAAGSGSNVQLAATDLAQIDRWFMPSNSQWILGDTVDVYASKEYFSQALTLNAKVVSYIHRKDTKVDGDELITMTYIGLKESVSVMSNPRVMIGTGLTIMARKTLRVRMAKTRNAGVPVQLRVVAQGKAVYGRKEEVTKRGPQLQLGGALRRSQGRWAWYPIDVR